jgi:uncharacterized phiE125 gp8 family phage protein
MLYNLLIDWKVVSDVTPIEEPVQLQEMKDYLRLEGFITSPLNTSSTFMDDNLLIESMIVSARERIEEFTGLTLRRRNFRIEFTNLAGNFEIPFQPVNSISYVYDDEGDSIATDDFEVSMNNRIFKSPHLPNMQMTFQAGYSLATLPKGLKEAIMKEVAYRYINRGDENVDGLSKEAMNLAARYKTTNWLG